MNRRTRFVFLLFTALFRAVALAQEPSARHRADDLYWPTHGWRFSTPEAQGMDSEMLAQAFDYIRQHNIPILVVRAPEAVTAEAAAEQARVEYAQTLYLRRPLPS